MKKMTINIICVMFSLILVFAMSTNVYANTKNENVAMLEPLLKEMEGMNASYHSQIETIMQKQGISGSYDVNNAYRVTMMEPLFLTILNNGGEFKDAFTDVVQWKVPIVTASGESGLVVLLEKEGELSYIGKHAGEITEIWQITTESIRKAIQNAAEFDGEIDSIQIVHSYLYNTAFVYMDGEKNDYLIPYGEYSKETGLENGKVYTVSDVKEKFNRCFDETIMTKNPSHNGDVPFRTSVFDNIPMVVAAAFVIVGGFVALLFWFKKKKIG